jgi:hypothetical protein
MRAWRMLGVSSWLLGGAFALSYFGCATSATPTDAPGDGGSGGDTVDTGIAFDTSPAVETSPTPDSSCGVTTVTAEPVPLDVYFMLDTSFSMDVPAGISGKLIDALRDGISSFVGDQKSAGIWAAGQHFPIIANAMLHEEACEPSAYSAPAQPWTALPSTQMADWVKKLEPDGLTPSPSALQGGVNACKTRLAQQAGHKCAVIFVTDGEPQQTPSCGPSGADAEQPLGQIASDAIAAGIPVFAVGFPGLKDLGKQILATIAQQGGTTAPTVIEGGDVSQQFIDALGKIRGAALSCEYKMPDLPAGKKPSFVTVQYTPGAGGASVTIKRKVSPSDCAADGGWYYDDNDHPTKITMCGASCSSLQNDAKGQVQVLVMCDEVPL